FPSRRLRRTRTLQLAGRTLREIELQAIQDALDRHQGNKPKAAEELGISLKTLYNKLNQASALGKTA
ncbi:MAG TPA: sigma-54-dependent Fis family transcriptional regulator, partial [Planctomycetaceae bacterium]|nr:sigma-54-dependent Fis family transcriptional regulator [Planctomycetaceae bacterium]